MHSDPSPYFAALDKFARELQQAENNPTEISATDVEMIILSGALYIRKLDEHGYLAKGIAPAGRTVATAHVEYRCPKTLEQDILPTTLDFHKDSYARHHQFNS